MSSNDTPLIQLQEIKKVFYTEEVETHALSDVRLEIRKGEYVSIAGPSGGGKTTLLSILGLLDAPTGGEYLLDGQPVATLSAADRARVRNRQIGFVFQAFNLIGDLSVHENVELPHSGTRSLECQAVPKRVTDNATRETIFSFAATIPRVYFDFVYATSSSKLPSDREVDEAFAYDYLSFVSSGFEAIPVRASWTGSLALHRSGWAVARIVERLRSTYNFTASRRSSALTSRTAGGAPAGDFFARAQVATARCNSQMQRGFAVSCYWNRRTHRVSYRGPVQFDLCDRVSPDWRFQNRA